MWIPALEKRMMNRLFLWIALGLLFLGVKTSCAEAQGTYYDGNIVVDSIHASIIIDQDAALRAEYTLINRGDTDEEIELDHPSPTVILTIKDEELVNPLSLKPYEEVLVAATDTIPVGPSPYQTVTFIPSLLFNGMRNAERAKEFKVQFTMPEGVEQIVGSNTEWTSTSFNDSGRLTLSWESYDRYPTMLSISWTTLDVDLYVSKTASPVRIENPEDVITVVVTIENRGEQIVEGIVLSDDFFPREFEPVEPQGSFTLTSSIESDPHIFWRQEILRLEPGQEESFTYQVRSLLSDQTVDDILLKPCQVRVEGILVAASNQSVVINDIGSISPKDQVPAAIAVPTWPIILLILGSLLGVGFILTAIFLTIRNRRIRNASP